MTYNYHMLTAPYDIKYTYFIAMWKLILVDQDLFPCRDNSQRLCLKMVFWYVRNQSNNALCHNEEGLPLDQLFIIV